MNPTYLRTLACFLRLFLLTSPLFSQTPCGVPTIVCQDAIAESFLRVNNGGVTTVWTTDMLSGRLNDDCTSPDSLYRRLVIVPTAKKILNANGYPTNGGKSWTFTCADYKASPDSAIAMELWTYNDSGKIASCTAKLRLQDNAGVCSGAGGIGDSTLIVNIETENKEFVNNAIVSLYDSTRTLLAQHTADQGYIFNGLQPGKTVFVSASKNDDPLNGVTTYDIALIYKHILGISPLNSPYKIIAADVNKDGDITAADVLAIRKLILHITDQFPNGNTSWRFIDASYIFLHPENPFPDQPNVGTNQSVRIPGEVKLIAIKVGDVNGSAIPN